mgnify:CR=1 FL=1
MTKTTITVNGEKYTKVKREVRTGDVVMFEGVGSIYRVKKLPTMRNDNCLEFLHSEISVTMVGQDAYASSLSEAIAPGTLIKIVAAEPNEHDDKQYANGDVFEVGYEWAHGAGVTTTQNLELWHREYEVFAEVVEPVDAVKALETIAK